MARVHDYSGMTFEGQTSSIKVLERAPNSSSGKTRWFCDCSCGQNSVVISTIHIQAGHFHCGCQYTGKSKALRDMHIRLKKETHKPYPSKHHHAINHYLTKHRTEVTINPVFETYPEGYWCSLG